MQRASVSLLILALSAGLLSTGAGAGTERGRRWPTHPCRAQPGDRPTLLTAFFQGRTDRASWRYGEAREALRSAGVPTKVLRRNGRKLWDAFAYAGGRAGRLVPAGRRLRDYEPPRRVLVRPQVFFDCAGREGNRPRFFIQIPADIHAREIVNDHGGREKILGRLFRSQGTRFWDLRRRPHSGTVQRMLAYLRDERVFSVEMERLYEPHSGGP